MKNDNLQQHLKVLSVDIGQRQSTSENEKRAAEYILQVFKENNISSKIEEFRSPHTFTWQYFLIYSFFIISFFLFFINNLFSFIFAFSGLILFILEIHSIEAISKVLPKRKSQNVIGEVLSKNSSAKNLIIVAHYDSSRAGSAFNPKVVKNFYKFFIIGFTAQISIALVTFLSLIFKELQSIYSIILFPSVIWIFLTIILLLHREFFFPISNGANDNASGTSVLLHLAEYFSKNRKNNLNITFLATGAEEVGLVGMLHFIKNNSDKIKNSLIINLDNLGCGELRYIIGEGMIKTFFVSSDVIKIIEKVLQKNSDLKLKPYIYKTMLTDATAALIRGHKAFSIMAFDKGNLLPNWHWITDTFENIDIKNLYQAFDFVIAFAEEINT